MRILIQRVSRARVIVVNGKENGLENSIEKGLLLLVGIGRGDKKEDAFFLANKIYNMRIFENNGKFDLSLSDINGEVLVVPQFTLYGNVDKGRRPEFIKAEKPERANELFEYFYKCMNELIPCKKGFFGKKMKVELVNDGPVTLMVEK